MKIGKTDIEQNVYVIAEIGGNHNGDPEIAYRLVEEAANAGAQAVKFQTYEAETLVHPSVEPVPIVKKLYATQFERFKDLELEWSVYERIIEICKERNIDFLTTPFDLEILEKFSSLMPAIKISSGDLTYPQIIKASAELGKPVIISTGMSTMEEIEGVVGLVPADQLALLHCVSIYPLPDEKANLSAIEAMKMKWPEISIGYSDHTIGIEACTTAVALGARIIEKHFTLDKSQVPGDHPLSADPTDLKELMLRIERISSLRGKGGKHPAEGEEGMGRQMRRGVYAASDLPAGHTLSEEDLLFIRPVTPLAPADSKTILGRRLKAPLEHRAPITLDDLS